MTSFLDTFKKYLESSIAIEEVSSIEFFEIDNNTIGLKKWAWSYQDALKVQEISVEYIHKNKDKKIFIFCNHTHCFTMGRGLQKGKEEELKGLVEFNPAMTNSLKYPVHNIKRGGGITFHYPGQWIIYPIVNLNSPEFSLKDLTHWVLDNVKKVLENDFNIKNLSRENVFLGLWHKNNKVASIGIGVKRFVTYHGLALNIYRDDDIFKEVAKTNPCGINANTYKCVEELVNNIDSDGLIDTFHNRFIEKLQQK